MPLAHGSIRRQRDWRVGFRRSHLGSCTPPSASLSWPNPAASLFTPGCRRPQSRLAPLPRTCPCASACGGSRSPGLQAGVLGLATPGVLRALPHLSSPEAASLPRPYPTSSVVRASPPPCPAPSVPDRIPVGACPPPAGLPVLLLLPSSAPATVPTPAEPSAARVARSPLAGSLRAYGGSASALLFLRPAPRSLLVVACAFAAPPTAALFHRSASVRFVTSSNRSDCYRLEQHLPGGIRIGNSAFPRRTPRTGLSAVWPERTTEISTGN